MYDSDGEAVGFLLADSAPVYYGKNLQGDITALYDHEGNYIVGYIYDAYGNIVSIDVPVDDSMSAGEQIGKMVVAFFYASFNPLSYRGYLYAPAIGLSYYLGSRFYCPAICRFLNADVYADTGTGAAGTNMFAYCNNNPVMFTDPEGTVSHAIALVGIPIGYILIAAACLVVIIPIITNGNFAITFSQAILALADELHYSISKLLDIIFAGMTVAQAQELIDFAMTATPPLPPNQGGNGTITSSKTLYEKRNARIDVEVPPDRTGNIHIHVNGEKYYYNVATKNFRVGSYNGNFAPSSVQKLLTNKQVIKAIAKGLVYLGY